ncbi:acyl-ACP--UDP-N-acetylglucosamine O-acyltransferase [Devosia sp. BK]|uniref:acyl-ACP--UDP-N-acetylglucosamine O-acyltransferase n=1 Tax=unclassified Devosia TaxID=196773 RepID=UPI0007163290|nr:MULTISPECIES: acyl-ACP--UDP-N-acetylglucosamine O-acyltransferase [unclassified Devosia]KQN74159.1 UDP-N-acetylglucosamine O-acyltransferase [Devosia sp. Leaf64]KQT44950.1 UDP-N-acetylglucosamine O-acyltransferase [Devosia sp. Leaf420]MDV3250594.1 acyl-ACP--UDP-N-acetylglucosamine O-acyltransferase [Devosia sp. BK]
MSDTVVHPTAIVASGAQLGAGVKIGPYSIVGENVVLGDGVELISHAVIEGRTTIGADTKVFPFASVGHQPQDLKFHGELSRVEIGARCTIRESVTINPGTEGGGMLTKIGDDCLLMACSHVAHDVLVGNNVVLANYVGLAGHSVIGNNVRFGGMCGVHQFVRIGDHAFVGAHSMVDGDVIPYGMAIGNRARLAGLNLVGLKRAGFDREELHRLRAAYRMIFSSEGTLRERVDDAAGMFKDAKLVQDVVSFIASVKDRPLCLPRAEAEEE